MCVLRVGQKPKRDGNVPTGEWKRSQAYAAEAAEEDPDAAEDKDANACTIFQFFNFSIFNFQLFNVLVRKALLALLTTWSLLTLHSWWSLRPLLTKKALLALLSRWPLLTLHSWWSLRALITRKALLT